jgi:hypothetical protein
MKQAMDNAIESEAGMVALVDGVVYLKSWYQIEGTPLIDSSLLKNSKL